MAYAPTVAGTVAPSPRAVIGFDTVAPGTVRADVYVGYGRTTAIVRDGGQAYASGGFTITDYETPIGVETSYWAEMFDTAGVSLGETSRTTVVLYGEQGYGWFSDPLVPAAAVQVTLGGSFGESLSRVRRMERYQVGDTVVALAGPRGLLEQVNLFAKTYTIESADLLADVLDASFVLVRTTPRIRVPSLLYVAVGEVSEVERDVQYGGEWIDWPLVGDQLSRTNIGVALPPVSYQRYMDAFATYAAAMSTYSTYLDAAKNPPGGTV